MVFGNFIFSMMLTKHCRCTINRTNNFRQWIIIIYKTQQWLRQFDIIWLKVQLDGETRKMLAEIKRRLSQSTILDQTDLNSSRDLLDGNCWSIYSLHCLPASTWSQPVLRSIWPKIDNFDNRLSISAKNFSSASLSKCVLSQIVFDNRFLFYSFWLMSKI